MPTRLRSRTGERATFPLLERLIERSRQTKPSDGQLAIEGRADCRKIVGAKMRVHREADDRDVPRRLVRLERPVDRRSPVERRIVVGGKPIRFQVFDIAAPIPEHRTDETDVPDHMQIARRAIVLGRARKVADRKVVVAVQFAHRVQRLIDVADEVDDELERIAPLRGR
jgi:hypothetical protein